jgi:two-component system nitrate/nitrite response regulator NarL
MGERISIAIIEPRLLVREALVSLMEHHSYRVVSGVASTADIDPSVVAVKPDLAVLGALSANDAAIEAIAVHEVWPETKVILLFEHTLAADIDKLLASEIDGCIPLFVSPETLIETLKLILVEDLRILVLCGSNHPSKRRPSPSNEEPDGFKDGTNKLHSGTAAFVALPCAPPAIGNIPGTRHRTNGVGSRASSLRSLQGLSEREEQILRGLVKGYSNKMIARTRAVAEATVKVHMKSILRKMHVANRTQAAIWALEHGYFAETFKDQTAKGMATLEGEPHAYATTIKVRTDERAPAGGGGRRA